MRRIRGDEPGAISKEHIITDKRIMSHRAHWVAWSDKSIMLPGNHRNCLSGDLWTKYDIGDQIEIVYVPGDSKP